MTLLYEVNNMIRYQGILTRSFDTQQGHEKIRQDEEKQHGGERHAELRFQKKDPSIYDAFPAWFLDRSKGWIRNDQLLRLHRVMHKSIARIRTYRKVAVKAALTKRPIISAMNNLVICDLGVFSRTVPPYCLFFIFTWIRVGPRTDSDSITWKLSGYDFS